MLSKNRALDAFGSKHKKRIAKTLALAPRGKKHRKYDMLWLAEDQKHRYLQCFFDPERKSN